MFFEFGIKDFIDILLVAFVLYYTYKLMKASGSIKVFTGILVFILIWLVVTQVLEMKLLGSIFDTYRRQIIDQRFTMRMNIDSVSKSTDHQHIRTKCFQIA